MNADQIAKARDRFSIKVDKTIDCWLWTAKKSRIGYGVFRLSGKMQSAHRVSWMIYKGSIDAGKCVLHTCHNRACVKPGHLYLGTQQDNANDRAERGFTMLGPLNHQHKTHCLRGHDLNIHGRLKKTGGRDCRACRRDRYAARRH